MECLDANAVQDLMSGALDTGARTQAVQHLDQCDDCRGLLSLLAKDATRIAALATLSPAHTDPGLASTKEAPAADGAPVDKRKLVATVQSHAGGYQEPADPMGVTAEMSLMRMSGARQIGKTFGRYTLTERIGAGAMGVVYKALDPGLNRRVALKLLHKPDAALTDRLIREARSMAQVNHPNVVAVYDAGVSEGSTYIAMELVEGQSLRTWQQEKHSIKDLVETYLAAGRGLAAAHAAGIVHRDFKPDNVMIGSDGRVRVTDFGLASARPNEELASSVPEIELTHSGMVLGTPAYMSPEQFTGGNVDPRTDQFNYCVALYEALYGERPFKGKSFDELGDNVCDGKIKPAPARSRVSGALRAILLRGLSVRPGDRYPTMDHLLDDLGRDRARPWRRLAFASAILAGTLAIGLAADFVVRDRVSQENNQSFAATGVQIGRAFRLLADRFNASANQIYYQQSVRDLTSYRDQADFGLGDEETDLQNRRLIHQGLVSQDWSLFRQKTDQSDEYQLEIAVADYKGRLSYTSANPEQWQADLQQLPWIKRAFAEGKDKALVLQPTNDPQLVKTGLLGKNPPFRLAIVFARTLWLGNGETKENNGTVLQAIDATGLINDIKLDDEMLLAIVSPEGVPASDANFPPQLIAAAPKTSGEIAEVEHAGRLYQVKTQELKGFDREPVGQVVMARELGGVLSGLFPGARTVFAITALVALALALATMLRMRQLAR
ncbi:MAG TPA: serine/threonine-protein kinase [Kofleriaceae bacterium]|nr:serine/threonine-protein kinase [Kofleriaceae bacterium]